MSDDTIRRIFGSGPILEKILDAVLNSDCPFAHKDLRLVNNAFNMEYLKIIRLEHREVEISPLPRGDEDDGFMVNCKKVLSEECAQYFEFLNVTAKISIEALIFHDFDADDHETVIPGVHEAVMYDLVTPHIRNIKVFRGASDLCPIGCSACWEVAKNATCYGPMQMRMNFAVKKHFRYLSVSEIFINEVAHRCAFRPAVDHQNIIEEFINPSISCDHLKVILSDHDAASDEPPVLPLEVFQLILKTWRVKKVSVDVLTGYSENTDEGWATRKIFTAFKCTQPIGTIERSGHVLESLHVYLLEADAFGAHFFGEETMGFENCLSNLKRLFPARVMTVCLPDSKVDSVYEIEPSFVRRLQWFTWNNDLSFRHVRVYSVSLRELSLVIRVSRRLKTTTIVRSEPPVCRRRLRFSGSFNSGVSSSNPQGSGMTLSEVSVSYGKESPPPPPPNQFQFYGPRMWQGQEEMYGHAENPNWSTGQPPNSNTTAHQFRTPVSRSILKRVRVPPLQAGSSGFAGPSRTIPPLNGPAYPPTGSGIAIRSEVLLLSNAEANYFESIDVSKPLLEYLHKSCEQNELDIGKLGLALLKYEKSNRLDKNTYEENVGVFSNFSFKVGMTVSVLGELCPKVFQLAQTFLFNINWKRSECKKESMDNKSLQFKPKFVYCTEVAKNSVSR
ncbi:unnamed protein product [Caenorhabditis sp. 36 PRJEB53466]|nr:unnamed protein product [Caenorhabditis sp. 36 PRJEB53466]